MDDPDWRQWMSFEDLVEACPPDYALAISTRQPFLPYPNGLMSETSQTSTIATNAIVGEVAPQHRGEVAMLIADRPMPISPAPVTDRSQSSSKTALGRDLHHHVFSSTRPSPYVGQAKKVEVDGIRFWMACSLRLSRAKVDEPRLVGVKH